MTVVLGCDYSTRAVDLVALDLDTDQATWHRFELTGQDAFERARSVRAALPGSSFFDDVLAVGIEDPRGYNAGALYRVQGAVLACLPVSVLVQPWIPSAWRREVGLPGNASKADVATFANRRRTSAHVRPVKSYGSERHAYRVEIAYSGTFNDWPQDACDAYAIALATRSRLLITEAA